MIVSASLAQTNGWQRSFQPLMNAVIDSISSSTELKVPRRMAWRVMSGPTPGSVGSGTGRRAAFLLSVFPSPPAEPVRAGCPRTGLSTCLGGSADEFGDLPDEGDVVMTG